MFVRKVRLQGREVGEPCGHAAAPRLYLRLRGLLRQLLRGRRLAPAAQSARRGVLRLRRPAMEIRRSHTVAPTRT